MQDQEFTNDQFSENTENKDAVSSQPETENLHNFNTENTDAPQQETAEFSQTVENPSVEQFDIPVQNVSFADADEEELFDHYEIKSWEFTPRIYKIFAFSAIINVLFLVGVAQTNILRAKACDSPLVGGFCQVLDTLYVGGSVLANSGEFVETPYEPTSIEDAEIVWVDKTGMEPPLTYPAGYFQIANPEMFVVDEQNPLDPNNSGIPGIVNTVPPMPSNPTVTNPIMPSSPPAPTNNGVFNRAQRVPKTKGNEVPKDLPPGIVLPEDSTAKNNNSDVAKNEPKKDEQVSKQPDIKSENIADFRPNKEPLKDFAKQMVELRKDQNSGFDLSKNFSVEIAAVLTEEGKFNPKQTRYIASQGDEKMVNIVKNAIEKIGDSQVFYYLKSLGIDKINFVLEQNDNEIRAVIKSNLPSEQRAKTISSGFNGLMILANQNIKEADKELLTIIKASKFKAEGKDFIINFNLDKNTAQAMIKEQLDKAEKAATEDKIQKPNGNAQTVNPKEKTAK